MEPNREQEALSSLPPTRDLINDLPTETLQKIMECYAGQSVVDIPISVSQAPWPLTRVCSIWRQIALRTPKLWASITIFIDPDGRFNSHAIKELIRRNQGRPMDISLNWKLREAIASPSHKDKDIDHVASLCSVIFCEGTRIRKLVLAAELNMFPPLYHQLGSLPRSMFESIEELTFNPQGDLPMPDYDSLHVDFKFGVGDHPLWRAPMLAIVIPSSCQWGGVINYLSETPFATNGMSHLTHFSISGLDLSQPCAYQLLHTTPLLVSLKATIRDGDQPSNLPDSMLYLPNLKHLDIQNPLSQLLAHLDTPHLSTLIASGSSIFSLYNTQGFNSETIDFLRRCCSLTSLELNRFGVLNYQEILPAVPTLQKLRVRNSGYFTSSVMRSIVKGTFGGNLRQIFCKIPVHCHEDFTELMEGSWKKKESWDNNIHFSLERISD